jgi:hypothetical protein
VTFSPSSECPHEKRVLSAHRTPAAAAEFISTAEKRGVKVLIAAAGGAAHLAGVAAAHTLLPVLGVPMESASLKGMDSLLSTVQMPGGFPSARCHRQARSHQRRASGDRHSGALTIVVFTRNSKPSAPSKPKRSSTKRSKAALGRYSSRK